MNCPPSRGVNEKVAALEGVPLADLTPPNYDTLHDVIDPEALDTLCQPSGRNRGSIDVVFEFNGYRVSVSNDGSITVRDRPITGRNR